MRRVALKTMMVLGVALLAGCGFALRGPIVLPFNSAYVDAAPGSALGAMLSKQLAQQSKLATQRDKADVILKLSDESQSKDILTLSSTGTVQEYRLTTKVTIAASGAAGEEVLPPAALQQVRDYSYNPNLALASDALESTLRHDMNLDLLQQIGRRLVFVHKP
ncbi:MAG: LPS assembly lipoprotein LptE [Parasulfuritortus sp.]|nr:LPS assembly lipoprotein LptE [Parasulfuritortus sp.]